MDQSAKQQIIERLKEANNVLVTVSANPSVDQLAACIGFTLLLNKLEKHGTAVFSGKVPSTIEFLEPEKTLEKDTNSLRDFIISLDKSKADKLRYKVEDKIVKIFITPYRTSLGQDDLEFSQGDFNVDVVLALGVQEREELDQAIVAHGRILHDATVISINNHNQGNLGSINWVELKASSLCEMLVDVAKGLSTDPLDNQMATAFMTGIVAETERFSNDKTTPRTMTIASELMSDGANQQLIATKLETAAPVERKDADTNAKSDSDNPALKATKPKEDGALTIEHNDKAAQDMPTPGPVEPESKPDETNEPEPEQPKEDGHARRLLTDEGPKKQDKEDDLATLGILPSPDETPAGRSSGMVLEPPTLGGKLTANSEPEHLTLDPATDPLGLPTVKSSHILNKGPVSGNIPSPTKPPSFEPPPTLTSLEESVNSPHLTQQGSVSESLPKLPEVEVPEEPKSPAQNQAEESVPKPGEKADNLEDAREAVEEAIKAAGVEPALEPLEALGAQPVDLGLQDHTEPTVAEPAVPSLSESLMPPEAHVSPPPEPNPLAPPPGVTPVSPTDFPPLPSMPMSGTSAAPFPTSGFPPNLVPNTPPQDATGNNGPAAPPPPVPPPMVPPIQ